MHRRSFAIVPTAVRAASRARCAVRPEPLAALLEPFRTKANIARNGGFTVCGVPDGWPRAGTVSEDRGSPDRSERPAVSMNITLHGARPITGAGCQRGAERDGAR